MLSEDLIQIHITHEFFNKKKDVLQSFSLTIKSSMSQPISIPV